MYNSIIVLSYNSIKELIFRNTSLTKFSFTVWLQAQNYVSVAKSITRNINYFIIFRLNDNVSINNIIRNHNVDDIDKDIFKDAYKYSTREKFNFFMIDLKGDKSKRLRHNYLEFLSI